MGTLVAAVVYIETRLLWGEVIPGVHVWAGLPGGGGYPWGTEQVAYNTCLVQPSASRDCAFLNYNELFWIALVAAMISLIMLRVGPLAKSGLGNESKADVV